MNIGALNLTAEQDKGLRYARKKYNQSLVPVGDPPVQPPNLSASEYADLVFKQWCDSWYIQAAAEEQIQIMNKINKMTTVERTALYSQLEITDPSL